MTFQKESIVKTEVKKILPKDVVQMFAPGGGQGLCGLETILGLLWPVRAGHVRQDVLSWSLPRGVGGQTGSQLSEEAGTSKNLKKYKDG